MSEIKGDLVFALNGKRVVIKGDKVDPHITLNEYIRDQTSFKGTKLGCGEGGCGACVVTLSRWDPIKKRPLEGPVNSCLRPLASCDGCAITTVEGLGGSQTAFHPIQERVAGLHGTQCGYCTPGMVMAIYSNFKNFNAQGGKNLTMKQAEGFLEGNICRCTGYRPILDAVKSFAKDSDIKDHITGLTTLGPYDDSKDPEFPEFLKSYVPGMLKFTSETGSEWVRPVSLEQLFPILQKAEEDKKKVKLVHGNTSIGVYHDEKFKLYVDIGSIAELKEVSVTKEGVTVGGGASITEFVAALTAAIQDQKDPAKIQSFEHIIQHALRVASWNVRNVGTVAGNLMMAKTRGFLSDLATVLLGASVVVTVARQNKDYQVKHNVAIDAFFDDADWKADEIVYSVTVPWTASGDIYRSYKAAIRPQNAHAYINSAFQLNVIGEEGKKKINKAVLAFGGIMEVDAKGSHPFRAKDTEKFLVGKPLTQDTLKEALAALKAEVVPQGDQKTYKQRLVSSFFFKFFLTAIGTDLGKSKSATEGTYFRSVSSGVQEFIVDDKDKTDPAWKPVAKVEGKIQASGEARYTADIPLAPGTLYAIIVPSTIASGKILEINVKKALEFPGVVDVVTAKDIPGTNLCPKVRGFGIPQVPFIADDKVEFYGQPVAVILADTKKHGEAAVKSIEVKYEVGQVATTIKAALEKKTDYGFPLIHSLKAGDPEGAFKTAKHIIKGTTYVGSQKHFYMETQAAYCVPDEDGQLTLYCACQFHGALPDNLADVLKIPQSKIKVVLRRAGGAFGGKAFAYFQFACLVGLAAWKSKRPVMLWLNREEDMHIVGGREETLQNYEVAFDDKGKISAVKQDVQLGGGWSPDGSYWVCMVANNNLHQVYNLPNVDLTSTLVKTTIATRTAVRGPGEPGASYCIETILARIAFELGLTPEDVREANFYDEKDKEPKTPDGKPLHTFTVPVLWSKVKAKVKWDERLKAAIAYNKDNRWKKRGVAITPVNYHVFAFQKDALVNINNDGSVVIHHSGCEMGQGLNTKIAQIAASTLGLVLGSSLDLKLIRFADQNSSVLPNARGTGGSTGSEAAVQAVRYACQTLVSRLKAIQELLITEAEAKAKKEEEDIKAGKKPSSEGKQAFKLTWESLVEAADGKDVDLSARGKFDHFEKKEAFGYHNYGACFSEVEVDILTGEVNVLESNLTYDCGKSLNPAIDLGQIEGAFIMGLGHVLRESEQYDEDGKLLTTNTWTYKPPGARDVPQRLVIELIQNDKFEKGILSSKSSGEPPLVLAISIAMAVRQAIHSARADAGLKDWIAIDIPMTPDVIVAACGTQDKDLA